MAGLLSWDLVADHGHHNPWADCPALRRMILVGRLNRQRIEAVEGDYDRWYREWATVPRWKRELLFGERFAPYLLALDLGVRVVRRLAEDPC